MTSGSGSGSGSGACASLNVCDRYAAAAQVHALHPHNDQLVLMGLAYILIGGGMIQHFSKMYGITLPYTVMLLIFGILTGFWVTFDPAFTLQPGMKAFEHEWTGFVLQCNVTDFVPNDLHYNGFHLGNALRKIASMSPHLFLHLLLPPLLFESAFAMDWHIFSKIAINAIILAFPGLIVCNVLTGFTYMGFYGWDWEPAMLLGGILSATDPVAVVALLREMGVKKSLATLIEAESLLNDGSAVVVYAILLYAVKAGGLTAWLDGLTPPHEVPNAGGWWIVWVAVRMSFIGPCFGAFLGMISVRWLESNSGVDRDANVEIICTLAMPFLVFYLAETGVGPSGQMSGVLSTVCYGLVFASPYGRVRIDPSIEHFMHEFWSMVGHLFNTIIFVISGFIIVVNIDPLRNGFAEDIGWGFLMYVCLTVYRALLAFGVIPWFRKNEYGYTWKDALVLTWGGLRGAVGLVLAISVFNDSTVNQVVGLFGPGDSGDACQPGIRFQQIVLLHVAMVVIITLLVNAPSSGWMLKIIGFTKLTDTRLSMVQITTNMLKKRTREKLQSMLAGPQAGLLSDANWVCVQKLADFEQMGAEVIGQPYEFRPEAAWTPGSLVGDDGTHATAAYPVRTDPDMQSPRERKEKEEGSDHAAHLRWRQLHLKLTALNAFMGEEGENLFEQFRVRLRAKRVREAKYRMLETLKATIWNLYEKGQTSPRAANLLKSLILDSMDCAVADRKQDSANPLPFELLRREVAFRPFVLKLAYYGETIAHKSFVLRPLASWANGRLFQEYGRGYDLTTAYLIGFQGVLESHEHGHYYFSLDQQIDAEFKKIVMQNIKEATEVLAKLQVQWPKMCIALSTFRAARELLNDGGELIEHLKHYGGLAENEIARYEDMISSAANRLKRLNPVEALPVEERANFIPESFHPVTAEQMQAATARLERRHPAMRTRKKSLMGSMASLLPGGRKSTMVMPEAEEAAPAPSSDVTAF